MNETLLQVSPEQYEWTDGWPTVYFNWMMGEPRGQDEDCVMMNNTGQWITKSCHSKYGLVCKIPTGRFVVSSIIIQLFTD